MMAAALTVPVMVAGPGVTPAGSVGGEVAAPVAGEGGGGVVVVVLGGDPTRRAGDVRYAHFIDLAAPREAPGLFNGVVAVADPELLAGGLQGGGELGYRGAVGRPVEVDLHVDAVVGGDEVIP